MLGDGYGDPYICLSEASLEPFTEGELGGRPDVSVDKQIPPEGLCTGGGCSGSTGDALQHPTAAGAGFCRGGAGPFPPKRPKPKSPQVTTPLFLLESCVPSSSELLETPPEAVLAVLVEQVTTGLSLLRLRRRVRLFEGEVGEEHGHSKSPSSQSSDMPSSSSFSQVSTLRSWSKARELLESVTADARSCAWDPSSMRSLQRQPRGTFPPLPAACADGGGATEAAKAAATWAVAASTGAPGAPAWAPRAGCAAPTSDSSTLSLSAVASEAGTLLTVAAAVAAPEAAGVVADDRAAADWCSSSFTGLVKWFGACVQRASTMAQGSSDLRTSSMMASMSVGFRTGSAGLSVGDGVGVAVLAREPMAGFCCCFEAAWLFSPDTCEHTPAGICGTLSVQDESSSAVCF